jgi:hypothetical protein
MVASARVGSNRGPANGKTAVGKKVKSNGLASRKKQALRPEPRLDRTTFCTSREMDFFSEKELVTQTGHHRSEWALVVIKELIDNSLDACEEADIPPAIKVTADASGITVADNGPGLPESTLKGAMNFGIRASNREAYVAPDRGAQGNALKTLLPMPRVLDPAHGKLVITAHGKRHTITCGSDPITQVPAIHDEVAELPTRGTTVRMEWRAVTDSEGNTDWPFDGPDLNACASDGTPYIREQFRDLVEGFALFNPHATIRLNWFGHVTTWQATDASWKKWKPCKPTSPHWYELPHLERLIGAYIGHERQTGQDRLLSDFLAEFDGLSGSQKRTKVLDETGLKRAKLSALVVGGRLDSQRIGALLRAMQKQTRPVKPAALGGIGEGHLKVRLLAMGVLPESFRYSRKTSASKSKKSRGPKEEEACFPEVPWILESAFGWLGEESEDCRRIFTGGNWSAAIKNPFRSFGGTDEGLETVLSDMRVTRNEPVVFVLHLAHPRVEYTDRGKSALVIGGAS